MGESSYDARVAMRDKEIERLRARVAELEVELSRARAELRRTNLPDVVAAWD